jgi:hypothetical protein
MAGMVRVLAWGALAFTGDLMLGGWAAITVENPPLSVESGSRYRMEFTIRQHGVEPMSGLKPEVSFRATGGDVTSVQAAPAGKAGRYISTIPVPAGDALDLRISAGWHEANLALMPVAIVPKGGTPPVLAAAEWGRRLFVAKGCGTCHLNGDVPEFTSLANRSFKVGPELTGRRLDAAYVRQRITDPMSLPALTRWDRMPRLGLSASETDALVALIAGPSRAALR